MGTLWISKRAASAVGEVSAVHMTMASSWVWGFGVGSESVWDIWDGV